MCDDRIDPIGRGRGTGRQRIAIAAAIAMLCLGRVAPSEAQPWMRPTGRLLPERVTVGAVFGPALQLGNLVDPTAVDLAGTVELPLEPWARIRFEGGTVSWTIGDHDTRINRLTVSFVRNSPIFTRRRTGVYSGAGAGIYGYHRQGERRARLGWHVLTGFERVLSNDQIVLGGELQGRIVRGSAAGNGSTLQAMPPVLSLQISFSMKLRL